MNTSKQPMFELALSIATEAHRGQFDKAGIDYIEHPIFVASQVDSEEEKAVALLHDVIEDSPFTAEELLLAGLPETVVAAVQILSKKKGQDYQTYLENVKSNPLARAVKLADLKHNSDLSRLETITDKDLERLEKYKRAIDYLSM
ncbi:GTP pyrophosphokinase [Streptococcus sp. 517s]